MTLSNFLVVTSKVVYLNKLPNYKTEDNAYQRPGQSTDGLLRLFKGYLYLNGE